MEHVEKREMVELFATRCIRDIKSEEEVPNVNFVFDTDGFLLFKDVMQHPHVLEGYWTPDIRQEDIDFIVNRSNDDCPTLYVKDSNLFFEYLTDINNSLLDLYKYYGVSASARNSGMNLMRRIWLRMGISDMQDVEGFLDKQLQFVNNRTFDTRTPIKVGNFYDYDVFMTTMVNRTFDETTRMMSFNIMNDKDEYELPSILYDIDDNNTCYIYAVQNKGKKKDKAIERKLYKLNKGIENPNVHPSKVYAIMLFIQELRRKGITKVVVPSLQVLSYRYHELLSDKVKEELEDIKERLAEWPSSIQLRERYNSIKEWYDKIYEKQDYISYLKTEELYNLIYRLVEQDSSIEITNEVNLQGDSINLKLS